MVDYSGLENRRTERYRGFESLPFRSEWIPQVERFVEFFLFVIVACLVDLSHFYFYHCKSD